MPEIKQRLKKMCPPAVKRILRPFDPSRFATVSYAQEGEDLLIASFLHTDKAEKGFYVDIGAHHPVRWSNTYFFYTRGWRGINVDAMPGSMEQFKELRPQDINVECAISDKQESLTYYCFNEAAVNGFSAELSQQRADTGSLRIVSQTEIHTRTLGNLLDEHLPPGQKIDFLSVDVEGLDLQVLKSNNWQVYRPTMIVVEDTNIISLNDLRESEIIRYLDDQGYMPLAKTRLTTICVEASRVSHGPFGVSL